MRNLFRKALSRTVWIRLAQENKLEPVEVPPSQRVMFAVVFAITALLALTILEVAHMAFLGAWNGEIFAGIMSTITFILGIFIGQKA